MEVSKAAEEASKVETKVAKKEVLAETEGDIKAAEEETSTGGDKLTVEAISRETDIFEFL